MTRTMIRPAGMYSLRGVLALCLLSTALNAQSQPRARDLGIPFDGTTGRWNAVTDVPGIEVGFSTIIRGEGKLELGKGPVRTGVTAVFPRGKNSSDPVFAAWFTLNGNGEMTGTTWIQESGFLEGPVMITNTHSVGTVHEAVITWRTRQASSTVSAWSLPVVAETYDGFLNDINGFHVRESHVFEAIETAKAGPVTEGNVGGGTGMIVHGFKGGTGTSSRTIVYDSLTYNLGVLVQANYGGRQQLTIAGVPVGREIPDLLPTRGDRDAGSIIVVLATDAPLLPHQLKRLATRVSLGIGKTGGFGANSSGDIFVAFSTANPQAARPTGVVPLAMIPNDRINPFMVAAVQATEESIINAMVAAKTMTGVNGNTVHAIPHDRLKQALKKYNRLIEAPAR